MRALFLIFFLTNVTLHLSQDTLKNSKDFIITKDKKIIQKEYNSSKNYIKIIYEYDESGILIRRRWFDIRGRIVSVSLEK